MDFITHLSNSFGHNVIWVICDRLIKYVHFIALPTKFTAKDLAAHFSVEITRLHGLPKSIVSDHDPLFLSTFWKEFFKAQGTTLKYSIVCHLETDDQTEVVNKYVERYLTVKLKWYKYLHLVEFLYNTFFHTAIQMAPFRALYSRDPPNIHDYLAESVEGQPLMIPCNKDKMLSFS